MKSIGIATVVYGEDGKVISARFEPKEVFDAIDLNQLKQVSFNIPDDKAIIQHNAEMVMAGWFVRMNEVETADRDKFKITSTIIFNEVVAVEGDKHAMMMKIEFKMEEV